MKNKIVKALVLASIVSMTATGAAGLTFADENVATGDTATTSTDTATKKTVDDLEADLTKAQKTAGEKEAAFTEKLAAYTDAKKAATEDYEAKKTALAKTFKESKSAEEKALANVKKFTEATETEIEGRIAHPIREKGQNATEDEQNLLKDIDTYVQARHAFGDASRAYQEAVAVVANGIVAQEPEQPLTGDDLKTALANVDKLKKTYDEKKKTVEKRFNFVSEELNADAHVALAFKEEDEAIAAYEEALTNWLNAAKAVADNDKDALLKALATATTDLKTATEAYKKALTDLGTAKSAYEEATADLVQIYRLYHPTTHEHLWTKDANEKKVLSTERGWIYEGVAWLTKKKGTDAVPLYRLVYPFSGDHHYTTSENEVKDLTTKYGWISEDVAFYVPKEGDVPVYRLFNPGLKMGAHHFTTGENEYNTLGERGWTKENVAYKVSAKGALDTSEIKTEDSRIADAEKVYAN